MTRSRLTSIRSRIAPTHRFWLALLVLGTALGCEKLITDPPRYAVVGVSVARRNGEPVEGARLTLFTGDRPVQYAQSGPDGTFQFTSVPYGLYGVTVFPPDGYVLLENLIGGPSTSVIGNLTVNSDPTAPVHFSLLRKGSGDIFVLAADPNGTPVAGIDASLFDSKSVLQRGTTAPDGRVAFYDVPFGAYGVNLKRPSGFYDLGENPYVSIDGQVVESGTRDSVNFILPRCQGEVQTHVVDENGHAVANIPVSLYTAARTIADAITGADGSATFAKVDCGEYGVMLVRLLGYTTTLTRGVGFVDGVRVTHAAPRSATAALQVRTEICAIATAIRAHVRDASGAPVPGATLKLYTIFGDYRSALTGADGTVTFDQLPCTVEYGVKVVPPSGYSVTTGAGSSYFDGIKPMALTDLVFTLSQP
jgi:hypothetical protein